MFFIASVLEPHNTFVYYANGSKNKSSSSGYTSSESYDSANCDISQNVKTNSLRIKWYMKKQKRRFWKFRC
ncbi:hypothetical protein H5410_040817 [Solanum commersonii]|uniref:Uncharacterized protein n=1 Tax=Solanum commersonii TaxID=4109 RepID=A0A9J5XRX6_SOLCO|nr:hypothetical protein H5410_040817 [Solanum commersonii]